MALVSSFNECKSHVDMLNLGYIKSMDGYLLFSLQLNESSG